MYENRSDDDLAECTINILSLCKMLCNMYDLWDVNSQLFIKVIFYSDYIYGVYHN